MSVNGQSGSNLIGSSQDLIKLKKKLKSVNVKLIGKIKNKPLKKSVRAVCVACKKNCFMDGCMRDNSLLVYK
jgi:hypothetical protein